MGTSDSPGQKPLLKRQKTSMSSSSSTGSPHHPSTFLRTPSSSSLTSKKAKARLVKRPSSSVIPISLFRADPTTSDPEDAHAKNAEFGGFSDLGMDDCSMPRSPRPSTYSSLPPSPRLQAALDLGIDPLETLTLDKRGLTDVDNLSSGRRGQVGLGIGPDDLGRALGGLVDKGEGKGYKEKDRSTGLLSAGHVRSESDLQTLGDGPKDKKGRRRTGSEESDESFGAGSAGSEHGDTEVDEVEEEFWPARSRRPTLESRGSGRYGRGGPPGLDGLDGMNGMNGMGQSPPYAVNERGPSSPTSPKSPTSATHWTASSGDESKADGGDVAELTVGGIAGLWDILTDEAGEEAWDGWVADGKWERIANFLAVPLAVEKITLFGALLCLDGFLYNFTVLPLRATFALYRFVRLSLRSRQLAHLPPSHIHSILRLLLVLIPTVVLLVGMDASKMYHTVRGQDTIKLYVIFNALEIADRLCGAFGQDVLDTLFARETLSPRERKRGKGRKRQQARPVFFFMLSLGYVLAHSLIFFYMLVSLTVAINSYDYTLLSLLISNQFVEIKGSVFKKFEKENLFQIMCADIVERFQLSLMLCVIAIRNVIEMSGSDIAFLPKSFMRGKSLIDSIFSPVLFVIVSEMLVDWLKHAFITKFNHVRASVYGRYMDVLARDVLIAGSVSGAQRSKRRGTPVLLDQSPLVARRLGFASIPLACLVMRVAAQAIGMLTFSPHDPTDAMPRDWAWTALKWTGLIGGGLVGWGCLVVIKLLLGLGLLSFSAVRRAGMDEREREDEVNNFGRAAVGESKEETAYNLRMKEYMQHGEDVGEEPGEGYPTPRAGNDGTVGGERVDGDRSRSAGTAGAGARAGAGAGAKKGKKWRLEEVERWTMVKRIW